MSFKEDYSRYQQQITPDKDFLNELERKMDKSKIQNQRKKSKAPFLFFPAAIVGAAAAVILTVNLSGFWAKLPDDTNEGSLTEASVTDDINVGAVTDGKINYITGAFNTEEMFVEAKDIPLYIAKILSQENAVLYKSDNPTFEYEDKQEKEFMQALALIMEKAEKVEGDTDVSGSTEYYMLTDNEGNVIKFTVSGDILEVGEVKFKIFP